MSDPWLAYATNVNPGSAIQFVTADDGWQLEGQGAAPNLDMNLASGPDGTTFAWPGSSVSSTSDGGTTWQTILTNTSGVWGFDLYSPSQGWVVGVTTLEGTTDGGSTWQVLGEPPDTALVQVDFVSPSNGYGVTTDGQLVESNNGGASWTTNSAYNASDLCFSNPSNGYYVDQSGDVYQTDNAGTTWTQVFTSVLPSTAGPGWAMLACDASGAAAAIEPLDPSAGSSPPPYVVASGSGGSSWQVTADNPTAVLQYDVPAAPCPVAALMQLAVSYDDITLLGLPQTGIGVASATMSLAGSSLSNTYSTALPNGGVEIVDGSFAGTGYIDIQGVSLLGTSGWLLAQDSAAGGSATIEVEAVLLTTSDSGQQWKTFSAASPVSPEASSGAG